MSFCNQPQQSELNISSYGVYSTKVCPWTVIYLLAVECRFVAWTKKTALNRHLTAYYM